LSDLTRFVAQKCNEIRLWCAFPESGALIRETHQEKPTARLQDRGQPFDVPAAVLVAEDMEQAAVDHVVEPLGPVLERQGVFDQERDLHAPLGCLTLCPLDRHFQKVDAGDFALTPGEEKGRVPGAASGRPSR
jgi:hypothetical protein